MSGRARELDTDYSDVILRGILNPVAENDVTNKAYVDTVGENLAGEIAEVGGQLGNYLPLSGGTMGGALDMGSHPINGVKGHIKLSFYEDDTLPLSAIVRNDSGYWFTDNANEQLELLHVGGLWIGYSGTRLSSVKVGLISDNVLTFKETNFNNQVFLRGIHSPEEDTDAATKAYVDAADEGFLYVDGGRLYAHGDTPQDVFLDKIDFASQAVEAAGVATLSVSATTRN